MPTGQGVNQIALELRQRVVALHGRSQILLREEQLARGGDGVVILGVEREGIAAR